MAAGKTATPIVPSSLSGDSVPAAMEIAETNSSTFLDGVPVVLTSNKVAEAGATPATIWGFADRAAQNGTNKTSRVFRATPGKTFHITLAGTVPAAPIGVTAGLVKDAGGYWYADSASGTKQLVITGVDSTWVLGTDTNAIVEVAVMSSFIASI